MISRGLPLSQILDAIARWVEAQSRNGVLVSLLLLDSAGKRLVHGAAPSLPEAYNDAINGIEIGPDVGSCGTAAFTKQAVIVEDIAADPLWVNFRELALTHGLRACWSTPLIACTGRVLGTFAMYYRQPRAPSAEDFHLIRLVTRTAVLAIEHQQAEEEHEGLLGREQQAWHLAEVERQRLHALFMQAPAVIVVLRGPEHVFELVNPLAEQVIGAGRGVIGKPVREALPELQGQGLIELLDQVYVTGEAFEGKETLIRLDRSGTGVLEDFYFNFVYQPSRDEAGAVDGVLVHAVEVTAQVQARQRVEESEAKFRTLADSIPQLAWMAYPDGHIFWYNQRWYDYTGMSPQSQEGWGWQRVHDPAVLPQVMERWQWSLASGEPFDMVFPLRGADGVFRPFLTRVIPVKDEQGRVVRWFGTNTDITEQVQLQEALQASERALQEANRRKDEFLSIASHELRTPLTSAKANLQVIGRRFKRLIAEPEMDGATLAEQLERLHVLLERSEHALNRLDGLVADLLDVSRIQAGKLEMRPQRMDLVELVRESAEDVTLGWTDREVRLQGRLREPQAPVWVNADADRIRQVVTNYLTNANKYSTLERPIDIGLEVVEGEHPLARVWVRDAGPGLTEAQQRGLFERFSQVEGIVQQAGTGPGLGLGLFISRTIVERHGGQVGVESVAGQGSTFWFTLPLAGTDAG